MAKPSKKAQGTKVKKKIWIPVVAPKLFNERIVAETPVTETVQCIGRHVQSNMMTLTGDMRSQSINAKLQITDVRDGKAYSKIVRYEITSPALKRMVRRGKDRIDESLVYKTKDGVKVRIKPFLLTNSLTKSSVSALLRKRLKLFLFKKVYSTTYDDLFYMVVSNKLQKEIKESLSKLYPIRNVEIRVMHKEKDLAKITPSPAFRDDKQAEGEEPKAAEEQQKAQETEAKKAEEPKEAAEEPIKEEAQGSVAASAEAEPLVKKAEAPSEPKKETKPAPKEAKTEEKKKKD